jgi:hypothetical protein
MPYRADRDALEARRAAVEKELEALRARAREIEDIRTNEKRLAAELEDIRRMLDAMSAVRRGLPLLDNVQVASPCSASWDDMIGDDKTRFCRDCRKNVHNLSAMTEAEAEALLQSAQDGDSNVCVRFYRRKDGTVLTSDCPVGARRKRNHRVAVLLAGAGALAAAGVGLADAFVMQGKGPLPTSESRLGRDRDARHTGEVLGEPPVMGSVIAIPSNSAQR